MSRRQAVEAGRLEGLFVKAVMRGAERVGSSGQLLWDISARCQNPPRLDKAGSIKNRRDEVTHHRWVTLKVRCRKCRNCLKVRAWEWAARASQEVALWPRSYFVTLTLSPDEHYRAACEARVDLEEQGIVWDAMSVDRQFLHRARVIGLWHANYIKRVRKEMERPIRFMCVVEAHKSGDPHLHMLFHECIPYTADAWDTACVLKSQWRHGFSDVSGMDPGSTREVRYATKYLAKSSLCRVRNSEHYGVLRGPEVVDAQHGTL